MRLPRRSFFETITRFTLCQHLLILLSTMRSLQAQCPSKCKCGITQDLVAINCEDQDLTSIPMGIANNTELLTRNSCRHVSQSFESNASLWTAGKWKPLPCVICARRFRGNQILQLPANMSQLFPTLKKIDLGNNQLTNVPDEAFSGLAQLYSITLTANQITEVGGRLFKGIKEGLVVSVTHNNLTSLPKDLLVGFDSPLSLYLEQNQISSFSSKVFSGFVKLQFLSLKHNQLKQISQGAFHDIHDLFSLDLASNFLETLDSQTFKGLPNLETLVLRNNRLRALPSDIFKGITRLGTIDLGGNLFSYPPVAALDNLHKGVSVKMFNNPLVCDCNLASIIKNETIKQKISDIDSITCQNSKELILTAIEKLNCLAPPTTFSTLTSTSSTTSMIPMTHGRAGMPTSRPSTATSNHLPLLISIILGVFIILTIATVFVYLYRRPIMGRIVRVRTLSYHKRAEVKQRDLAREYMDDSPQSMRDLPDSAFV